MELSDCLLALLQRMPLHTVRTVMRRWHGTPMTVLLDAMQRLMSVREASASGLACLQLVSLAVGGFVDDDADGDTPTTISLISRVLAEQAGRYVWHGIGTRSWHTCR